MLSTDHQLDNLEDAASLAQCTASVLFLNTWVILCPWQPSEAKNNPNCFRINYVDVRDIRGGRELSGMAHALHPLCPKFNFWYSPLKGLQILAGLGKILDSGCSDMPS